MRADLKRLKRDTESKPSAVSQVAPSGTGPSAVPRARSARKIRLWLWPVAAAVVLATAYLLRPALPPPEVTGTTQLTNDGVRKSRSAYVSPMLTDGSRVYFQEVTPDNGWPMMQVSTEGGEPVPLDVPFKHFRFGDISPNGHELLLLTEPDPGDRMPLWRLSLPDLQPQRIGNLAPTEGAAAWSPDGSVLYYASHPDIFAADADGSHPRKLLTTEGDPWWIRVSPDGRLIRFSVYIPKNDTFRLWEAHSDGSGLRELLPGFSDRDWACCGDWTTDGKYFVFESLSGRGEVYTVWAMRDAGDLWRKVSHEPVRLTHGEMSANLPLPSRDGKKIFFVGSKRRGEVMRYDLGTHTMTPFLPGFSAYGLSFTKDGQRMAYVSYPEGILWQSRTDGSDRHQLTFPPIYAGVPRWSPDGSQIVFAGRTNGKTSQVFVIPSGGGEPVQVTSGDGNNQDATWSPDGNSLTYVTWPLDPSSATTLLHIVNLKTRQVTVVPNSAWLVSPRWSPDGRYLLATYTDDNGIMLYDFSLHSWQQLAKGKVVANYLVWTPDGKCVYFNSTSEKGSPEKRICLSDRKIQHVADMAQAGNLAQAGGWWTGLAPDGSILGLRDTSSEEIYALDVKFP